jgi:signal transduction histidine kinase
MDVARRTNPSVSTRRPEIKGRMQELVDAGDTRELARRSLTLQSVMLDLHRQLATAESQADLARIMGLALTGSFACERLVVLRRDRITNRFDSGAEIGDVPAALHEEAPQLAASLAPFLPHVAPLATLLPAFAEAIAAPAERLAALGFVRAAWLNVEKQVDWMILVGPKLSGAEYDTFDISLLRATLDAAALACSRMLLVDALEERHRELVAAHQRLQQIDDLKTAILATVSHEMRTPLTRIQMYAEAMRDDPPAAESTREFLDVILTNSRQLGDRIDGALQFAELVGGRTTPAPRHVVLPEIVRSVTEQYAATAAAAGIGLHARCEPLAALTDPEYVRMILVSLVDNALKFAPPGTDVMVELVRHEAGALVRVADAGPGIPDEARERIWRLFEQGDQSPRREMPGLGLGLALAQRLAADLGLRLELLQSSPTGSIFGVVFPDAAPAGTPQTKVRRTVASLLR